MELQDDAILKEFAKSAEEQSGCAAAAALWLSAYMAFLNAANDTFACARARAPRVCEGAMCFAAKSPRFSRHTRAFRLVTAPKSQEPAPRRTRVWTCSPRLARAVVRDSSGRERKIPKIRRTQLQLGEFRSRSSPSAVAPKSTYASSPPRATRPSTPLPICARACALADRPTCAWPCSYI